MEKVGVDRQRKKLIDATHATPRLGNVADARAEPDGRR